MTTLFEKSLKCPVCGEKFETTTVASTNQMIMHTDFRPVAMGIQPYFFFVHTCPYCYYSAYDDGFEEDIDPETAEAIKFQMQPWRERFSSLEPTPSYKYLLAALCAEARELAFTTVADLYLRGAWCAAEEGDKELEKQLREEAARNYIEGLESDEVGKEERAQITYLIGELLRRIGATEEAKIWFEKVNSETIDPSEQGWLNKATQQQMNDPKEFFEDFLKGV
ncbi:MAG: DUF2225 domain-containing protein [Planctomycetota bacterium]|nr:DUF2225 domain-containing protein [Planctomycetota bacterium]